MKFLSPVICALLLLVSTSGSAMRSDSVTIKHTEIHLIINNFSAKKIGGYCVQTIVFKVPTNLVTLDLKSLTTDSIICNNQALAFTHIGESLNVNLGKTYQANDSCSLFIYYHGTPASDPTGWGGFYFTGNYAFNLGVGFGVDPHSYGRAWFPCIDEFTIKSQYDFYIQTDTNYVAACNGVLQSVTKNGNTKLWHYHEGNVMSTYLASVSVSQYSILKSGFQGMNAAFPIWLYCAASDSTKVKNSFSSLPFAINAFEKAFGPQPYQKVGYNMVPFNSGAMEHAGNITYPASFADGTKSYETLFAHELSHHWWGDAVTCADAKEMWLNEGWASYCEHFFTEQLYGSAAYKKSIAANHYFVLRFAHIRDENIFSMVNIPTTQTYGSHVYKKGADVIHSLRNVMDDSVFFKACKAYQADYRFRNVTSHNLQSAFELNGGGAKATEFFNNWIYEKGSPHVIISKQTHTGNGPFQLKIETLQKPRFTNKLYKKLPVEVFFFKDRYTYEKRTIEVNNETDIFDFTFDFKPVFVCMDYDQKLSDAITEKNVISASNVIIDVPEINGRLMTKNIKDSAFIRLEHHWVGPEKYITTQPAVSNYRYVTLDGIWNNADSMDLELSYDGRQQGPNATTGYLDHTLIFKTEDSLTVLYRGFPGDYWRPWNNLQWTTGSKNDKAGKVLIKNAQKGDYVFAMYDQTLGIKTNANGDYQPFWAINPNPVDSELTIDFVIENNNPDDWIEITNELGQRVYFENIKGRTYRIKIETGHWATGIYTVCWGGPDFTSTKKLVIAH